MIISVSFDNVCLNANIHKNEKSIDMFTRQLLNTNQEITVDNGDSRSVKWTIIVG
jgi:hypothetical protein